jgi:hypothetical protein
MILKMRKRPLHVVYFKRATNALRRLARTQHEMLDKELAVTSEKL